MYSDGRWVAWDESATVPARWGDAQPLVAGAVGWSAAAPGVEWGEVRLQGASGVWRIRVVLVRLDPSALEFRVVVPAPGEDGFSGRWSVDDAPEDAVVALNAGQFTGPPWGWLVQGGHTRQRPGAGILAPGVAFLEGGRPALIPPDSLGVVARVVEGFQSYPALLTGDGDVPLPLRQAGLGVDLVHRDGRLALGILRDGRVLLALTRLEGLGGLLEVVPFGPTTPEMASLMGALGCARAVLLDGGISGQMMLVDRGRRRVWPGLRKVAAGLVVRHRAVPPP